MANYKTHAIHGELLLELILASICLRTEIKKEDLKVFCFGPDTLITSDYKIFDYQHSNRVKDYFESILRYIKENKLQDNSEVMAFLYGQLDHYVVDFICHPLIYYMTESMPKTHKFSPHALMENWIDDYIIGEYNRRGIFYFHKWGIKSIELRSLIDEVYRKVYGSNNEAVKYDLGITSLNLYDSVVRNDLSGLKAIALNLLKIGDITYRGSERVLPLLNLEHETWSNPFTGELYTYSFQDLWNESFAKSLEMIEDVNRYLYQDKPLNNFYIKNNISYNSGYPCEDEREPKFVKIYK